MAVPVRTKGYLDGQDFQGHLDIAFTYAPNRKVLLAPELQCSRYVKKKLKIFLQVIKIMKIILKNVIDTSHNHAKSQSEILFILS
jgi:hypothetical protein